MVFFRFRILFVHWIPCISLVILNFLLFRAMRDAEKKRAKLLNSNRKVNVIKGESKESKKIRDANTTTLMLIVVISVICLKNKSESPSFLKVETISGFPLRGGSIGRHNSVACLILVYRHRFSELRGRWSRRSSRQHDDLPLLSTQFRHLLWHVKAVPRHLHRIVHQTRDTAEKFHANGKYVCSFSEWILLAYFS